MNMQENYRLIEALESAGWTAQEIINLIKYVERGEEQYKPRGGVQNGNGGGA